VYLYFCSVPQFFTPALLLLWCCCHFVRSSLLSKILHHYLLPSAALRSLAFYLLVFPLLLAYVPHSLPEEPLYDVDA